MPQTGLDSLDKLHLARTGAPLHQDDAERLALLHEIYPACGTRVLPAAHCSDCGFVVARCPLRER